MGYQLPLPCTSPVSFTLSLRALSSHSLILFPLLAWRDKESMRLLFPILNGPPCSLGLSSWFVQSHRLGNFPSFQAPLHCPPFTVGCNLGASYKAPSSAPHCLRSSRAQPHRHTLHPIPQSLTAGLRLLCPPGTLKETAQGPSLVPTWSGVADFSLPWLDTSWPQVPLPDLPYPSFTAQEEKLSCPSSLFDSSNAQERSGTFHQKSLPTQIYSR